VFPRIKGVADATPFVEAVMQDHHTALGPGHFFDAPAHFRLSYGGDTDKIRGGLAHVAAALDARAPNPRRLEP
jgi:aspartate/methionine/tyrosine aminotransferase